MRIKTWHNLVLIGIIALLAGWIALPSDFLNFNGWKDDFYVREGLDLQTRLLARETSAEPSMIERPT